MKHRMRFDAVLPVLNAQQAAVVAQLREAGDAQREALLTLKRQLDQAVACLQFCEQHQIHPDAQVQMLPWPGEHFGGFVITEVNEDDHPVDTALTAGGAVLRLYAGDLLIEQGHGFNLPDAQETPGDRP